MKCGIYLIYVLIACHQSAFGMKALAEKQKKVAQDSVAAAEKQKTEKSKPQTVYEKFFADNASDIEKFIRQTEAMRKAAYEINVGTYVEYEEYSGNILKRILATAQKEGASDFLTQSQFEDIYKRIIDEREREALENEYNCIDKTTIITKMQKIRAHMNTYDAFMHVNGMGLNDAQKKKYTQYARAYGNDVLASLLRIAEAIPLSDPEKYATQEEHCKPLSGEELFLKDQSKKIVEFIEIVVAMQKAAYNVQKDAYQQKEDDMGAVFGALMRKAPAEMKDFTTSALYTKMYVIVSNAIIDRQLRNELTEINKKTIVQKIKDIMEHINTYDSLTDRKMQFVDAPIKEAYKKSAISYANQLLDGLVRMARDGKLSDADVAEIKKAAQPITYSKSSFTSRPEDLNVKPIEQLNAQYITNMSQKELAASLGLSPAFQSVLTKSGYEFFSDLMAHARIYLNELKAQNIFDRAKITCDSLGIECSNAKNKIQEFVQRLEKIKERLESYIKR